MNKIFLTRFIIKILAIQEGVKSNSGIQQQLFTLLIVRSALKCRRASRQCDCEQYCMSMNQAYPFEILLPIALCMIMHADSTKSLQRINQQTCREHLNIRRTCITQTILRATCVRARMYSQSLVGTLQPYADLATYKPLIPFNSTSCRFLTVSPTRSQKYFLIASFSFRINSLLLTLHTACIRLVNVARS